MPQLHGPQEVFARTTSIAPDKCHYRQKWAGLLAKSVAGIQPCSLRQDPDETASETCHCQSKPPCTRVEAKQHPTSFFFFRFLELNNLEIPPANRTISCIKQPDYLPIRRVSAHDIITLHLTMSTERCHFPIRGYVIFRHKSYAHA